MTRCNAVVWLHGAVGAGDIIYLIWPWHHASANEPEEPERVHCKSELGEDKATQPHTHEIPQLID